MGASLKIGALSAIRRDVSERKRHSHCIGEASVVLQCVTFEFAQKSKGAKTERAQQVTYGGRIGRLMRKQKKRSNLPRLRWWCVCCTRSLRYNYPERTRARVRTHINYKHLLSARLDAAAAD